MLNLQPVMYIYCINTIAMACLFRCGYILSVKGRPHAFLFMHVGLALFMGTLYLLLNTL